MIHDVLIKSLSTIPTEAGEVLHFMKKEDPSFQGFGEIYFSKIYFNTVKAWKKHKIMTLNVVVPCGEVHVVIYDDRKDSKSYGNFQSINLSPANYYRVTIPPLLCFGFKGICKDTNILVNFANTPHDPNEVEKIDFNSIDYNWNNQ